MRTVILTALVLVSCGQGAQEQEISTAGTDTETRELAKKASVTLWTAWGICAELADAVGSENASATVKGAIACSPSYGVDVFNLWGPATAGNLVGDGTPATVNVGGQEMAAMSVGFSEKSAELLFKRLTTQYSTDKNVRRSSKGNIECTNEPNGNEGVVTCVVKSSVRFQFGE